MDLAEVERPTSAHFAAVAECASLACLAGAAAAAYAALAAEAALRRELAAAEGLETQRMSMHDKPNRADVLDAVPLARQRALETRQIDNLVADLMRDIHTCNT